MDRPYVPTPDQVAGMQAMVEQRLAQYDQVWMKVMYPDDLPVDDGVDRGPEFHEGRAFAFEEIRAILEGRTRQDTDG